MTTTETYGPYGGRYVPETLIPALDELTAAWADALADPSYLAEVEHLGRTYTGRPSPITLAPRFAPGKRLYLKREDLNHTGAHKINNALGQVVLARRLGKTRIIAETGAGQHGVATATACARFGLECVVFMGSEDMRRQAPNVERMHLMGATVVPVEFGTRTLKEATSEAIRDWITNVETTHYVIGSCVGPAPYPEIVRELQAVIGREAREQLLEAEGGLPEVVVACVGGGSNAIGMFAGFVDDRWRAARRSRGGGCGVAGRRTNGGAPRLAVVDPRRRGRADSGRPFHLGGARLPGRGARARVPARHRAGRIPALHRRRGARGLPAPLAHRGDHPGPRVVARPRRRRRSRRGVHRRLPVGTGRQGSCRGVGGSRACIVKKALVIYLMAGADTPALAAAAVAGGADIVEIGFPFSDPLADGPVIRAAAEKALAAGMRTAACLECLAATRALVGATPLVPMTYASLLEAYGWQRFEADARAAGATSFIIADTAAGSRPELRRIQLVAPTSTDERIALAASETDGWLYLVTLTGTTGARTELSNALGGPRGTHACPHRCTTLRRLRHLDPGASARGGRSDGRDRGGLAGGAGGRGRPSRTRGLRRVAARRARRLTDKRAGSVARDPQVTPRRPRARASSRCSRRPAGR